MSENYYEKYLELIRIQKLFKSVLALAAKDAFCCRFKTKKEKNNFNDAQEFFESFFDFELVCRLANVDCVEIKKIVQNTKIQQCQKYKEIMFLISQKNNKIII